MVNQAPLFERFGTVQIALTIDSVPNIGTSISSEQIAAKPNFGAMVIGFLLTIFVFVLRPILQLLPQLREGIYGALHPAAIARLG